jgi:hypothetical protein
MSTTVYDPATRLPPSVGGVYVKKRSGVTPFCLYTRSIGAVRLYPRIDSQETVKLFTLTDRAGVYVDSDVISNMLLADEYEVCATSASVNSGVMCRKYGPFMPPSAVLISIVVALPRTYGGWPTVVRIPSWVNDVCT